MGQFGAVWGSLGLGQKWYGEAWEVGGKGAAGCAMVETDRTGGRPGGRLGPRPSPLAAAASGIQPPPPSCQPQAFWLHNL